MLITQHVHFSRSSWLVQNNTPEEAIKAFKEYEAEELVPFRLLLEERRVAITRNQIILLVENQM